MLKYYRMKAEGSLYNVRIGRVEAIRNTRSAIRRYVFTLCIFTSMTVVAYTQGFIPSTVVCLILSIYFFNQLVITILARDVIYARAGIVKTPTIISTRKLISRLYRDINMVRKSIGEYNRNRKESQWSSTENMEWVTTGTRLLIEWNSIIHKYKGHTNVPYIIRYRINRSIYNLYRDQSHASEPPV